MPSTAPGPDTTGGTATRSAADAAPISPALAPSDHSIDAPKHQAAATTRKAGENPDAAVPSSTAVVVSAETRSSTVTRPRGRSCRAVTQATAAAPTAAVTDPGGPHNTASAATTATQSRLRSTAARSGIAVRSTRPLVTSPF